MFFSYRRYLLPLGLGMALSSWPGVASALSLAPSSSPSAAEAAGMSDRLAQAAAPAADESLRLEPGEEARPLSPAEREVADPGQRPSMTLPQSQRPTDQGFEELPDYLTPDPNPLLLPTRPEEVEILGTQPLSLATAVELALRNSEQLRQAQLQLERSQAGLQAERAALLPTANLNATLENTNQTSFGFGLGDNATRLRGGISANYDLGLSGERAARIRAAEDQVKLAELRIEQTREELRLATITDYYAVQETIEQIRINQAFLTEAERNLRDTQLREEVGVGTRFDVLRAEVQVANARQTLTQAISQRQISQRQLARRLNLPPAIDLTTLAVEIAGSWPLSLEESIVLAFQNRAELEQFLVERQVNEAQRQIQLSQVRPNLGLFAQYDAQTLLTAPAGVSTGNINDGFSVGAQMTWRFFDGGAARARAAQSDADIQSSEVDFEIVRNDIRVRVEEAYYTLVANQANISTASVAVNQAEEALELANLRFNAGVGTQIDVLTATRELAEAEGNLVSAVLNYNRALARLEREVSNLAPAGAP